jgi:hypothetical protein
MRSGSIPKLQSILKIKGFSLSLDDVDYTRNSDLSTGLEVQIPSVSGFFHVPKTEPLNTIMMI